MAQLTLPALLREQSGGKSGGSNSGAELGGHSPVQGRTPINARGFSEPQLLSPCGGFISPNRRVDIRRQYRDDSRSTIAPEQVPDKVPDSPRSIYNKSICPRPMPREFFVNVILSGQDRSANATAAAKEHGRSKLGRIGSLLGGVMGTVMGGSAVFDGTIAQSVRDAVTEKVVEALRRQRWWATVVPMMLPPMPGKCEWLSYVSLGEKGHFMAFRVYVVGRLPAEEHSAGSGGMALLAALQQLFSGCWCPADESAEDEDRRVAREIGLIQPEIHEALLQRKHPINAQIRITDASEEFHILHELNWSQELCAQAVLDSRHSEDDRPTTVA